MQVRSETAQILTILCCATGDWCSDQDRLPLFQMGSWRRTRVLYEGLHCDAKGIHPTYIVFTVLVAVTFIVQTAWIVPSSLIYFFNSVSSSAAIASPTSLVFDLPPMSAVRIPLSMVIFVASSIIKASSGRHSEYLNIMLMERMVAMGLTMPLPAMSGAEPRSC
jgi:hypothetical protein